MNIFLRVDASCIIGSGHVMRALVLARALKAAGHRVRFICRAYPGNLIGFVETQGFEVITLAFSDSTAYLAQDFSDDYSQWLWLSQGEDAEATLQALENSIVDWLIVDHYALDASWEQKLRAVAAKIMVIDDLANRPHDCDLLLDQNYYVDLERRYDNLVSEKCKKLLGVNFALIRPELTQIREHRLKAGKATFQPLENILIFMGGADAKNMTMQILLHLQKHKLIEKYQITVVVGILNPFLAEIQKFCTDFTAVNYFVNPSNYSEFMVKADVIIGAGGSSAYERCLAGIPSIVFSVADNQQKICADLSYVGAHLYVQDISELSTVINNLTLEKRSQLFEKSTELFLNYGGVKSVINEIQA